MKRIFFAALLLCSTLHIAPSVAADPPLASCLSFRGETSSISSYAISISIPVYQRCGKLIHWGDFALVSIDGEDGLLGAGKCNSFLLAQGSDSLGEVYSGSISCTIVVSGWQASKRVGQTSSTVRVKYVWDNSSTSVSVRHPAIPSAGTSGSGSSSGGSTGGSTPVPAAPSCTSAPSTPKLDFEWNSTGPKFKYSAQTSGQKATALYWSRSLWNSSTNSWEPWSAWTSANVIGENEYQAAPEPYKTKIAFAVYALNSCGTSEQARESVDKYGIYLAGQITDVISKYEPFPSSVDVGNSLNLYGVAKSQQGLLLEAVSLTPGVCLMNTVDSIRLISGGDCKLSVTSKGFQNKIGAQSIPLEFSVTKPKVPQSILDLNLPISIELTSGSISLTGSTTASLQVQFEATTDEVCFVAGDSLVLRSMGTCKFLGSQPGDLMTLAAPTKSFQIEVIDSRATLVCVKGKITKKIKALKPKCPGGYKVKK